MDTNNIEKLKELHVDLLLLIEPAKVNDLSDEERQSVVKNVLQSLYIIHTLEFDIRFRKLQKYANNALEIKKNIIEKSMNLELELIVKISKLIDQFINDYTIINNKVSNYSIFSKNILLIVPLISGVFYGIYFLISTLFFPQYVKNVGVIYPKYKIKIVDDKYLIDDENKNEMIKKFENYYFSNFISKNKPDDYPYIFDRELASEFKVTSTSQNMFAFYVVIKNIENNCLISKISITTDKSKLDRFPFEKYNLATDLEIEGHRAPEFKFSPTKRPVFDVDISAKVDLSDQKFQRNFQVKPNKIQEIDHKGERVEIDFLPYYHYLPSPIFGLVTKTKIDEMNIDGSNEYILNDPDFARQFDISKLKETMNLSELERIDSYYLSIYEDFYKKVDIGKEPLYLKCDNNNYLLGIGHYTRTKYLKIVDATSIKLEYKYSLLNGKEIRKEHEEKELKDVEIFDLDSVFYDHNFNYFLNSQSQIFTRCIKTADSYNWEIGRLGPMKTGSAWEGRDKIMESIAAFADIKPIASNIAIVDYMHVNENGLKDDTSKKEKVVEKIINKTIKSGDYILLNVMVTDFSNGVMSYNIKINDQPVDTIRFERLWPTSLNYKSGDRSLFMD